MQKIIKMEIRDLYGGDGFTRDIEVRKETFARKKNKKIERVGTVGLTPQTFDTKEENFEIVKDKVHTFRKDEQGNLLYRLGGSHGKLWGAMKASGKMLVDAGDPEMTSLARIDRLMMAVNISPGEVVLENCQGVHETQLPQKMAGMGSSMTFPRYDVIDKCTATVTLFYPDNIASQIEKILVMAQNMSHFNKRRATFKIITGEENGVGK